MSENFLHGVSVILGFQNTTDHTSCFQVSFTHNLAIQKQSTTRTPGSLKSKVLHTIRLPSTSSIKHVFKLISNYEVR